MAGHANQAPNNCDELTEEQYDAEIKENYRKMREMLENGLRGTSFDDILPLEKRRQLIGDYTRCKNFEGKVYES